MKTYKYLIVGGGLAGDAAVRGIRELDQNNLIAMLSTEPDPPYLRPALSKGLWKGRPMEKVWRRTTDLGVDLFLSHAAGKIDPRQKLVQDEKGEEYGYEKLLLATGGTPNHLPFGNNHIIYFRDLQDYKRLRSLTEQNERFLVIGGSFIGSEIAAALTMAGKKVSMVFIEKAICGNFFPEELANHLNTYFQEKGVELVPESTIASLDPVGSRFVARTGSGRSLEVDGVVAGIGIRPNIELAKSVGLQVDNGVVVNEYLATSQTDIYAAGDVANFFHKLLGKRKRVEHEDNALIMGKTAGRNMAGASDSYTHAPMFYSDLFELGYEAVGEMSSKMKIVSDWKEPFKKGVLYFLDNGRVRGVLLWDVWKKVDEARALLAEPGPFKAADLIGRIKD